VIHGKFITAPTPGIKSMPVMFLMTDAQVPDEKFLVLINDLLASGEGEFHDQGDAK
jgi:hypothetical protein